MPSGDEKNSITFTTESNIAGFPAIVDDAFRTAVAQSSKGGAATQQYFDALNQTSDFWGDLAAGRITFAPGVDPQGNPVYMASNGNVELRLAASYVDGNGLPGSVVGNATVTTRNTTTSASAWTALAVRLATMPVYLKITADIFGKLLVPVYRNTARVLTDLAARLQAETAAETPAIDALAASTEITRSASGAVDDIAAELGEEGVDYLTIEWGAVALDFAGLAPLMALPMIFEELGHQMTHALIVQNLTGHDFTWNLAVPHGRTALQPGQQTLAGMRQDSGVTLSSSLTLQHVNSTDYSSIGYGLTLTPAGGGPPATLVVDIPWAGTNGIWVGAASDPAQAYTDHSGQPDGQLSSTAVIGDYRVTLSLNKTTGQTYDSYYYCSTAVIEAAT